MKIEDLEDNIDLGDVPEGLLKIFKALFGVSGVKEDRVREGEVPAVTS
jgi:hypothetical protein